MKFHTLSKSPAGASAEDVAPFIFGLLFFLKQMSNRSVVS
jgi:hypothetical protein